MGGEMGYRLVTYAAESPRAGLVIGEEVFDAAALTGHPGDATVLGILEDWAMAAPASRPGGGCAGEGEGARRHEAAGAHPLAVGDLLRRRQLCRPCRGNGAGAEPPAAARSAHPRPQAVALHQGRAAARRPGRDGRDRRDVADHGLGDRACRGDRPPGEERHAWAGARHVAGYTIANDLSARDMGRRTGVPDDSPFKFDWVAHKNFDGACPLGPWIVPASDIPDPQNLSLKLWVNDVIKQDSNTAKMILSIAEQIAHLTSRITLNPGDVVLTGTPSGVGAARKEFLKAGDKVKLSIEQSARSAAGWRERGPPLLGLRRCSPFPPFAVIARLDRAI